MGAMLCHRTAEVDGIAEAATELNAYSFVKVQGLKKVRFSTWEVLPYRARGTHEQPVR